MSEVEPISDEELAEVREYLHPPGNGAILTCTTGDMSVHRILARLDDLQAVVDKLPKTADGVHVVPGVDIVYAIDDRGTIWDSPIGWNDGFGKGYHSIRGFCRPVSECYSTRELAEAALAASHADTEDD